MDKFLDIQFVVTCLNLMTTGINAFWSIKIAAIKGSKELLAVVTEQSKAKDEIIASVTQEKNHYKLLYTNHLKDHKLEES